MQEYKVLVLEDGEMDSDRKVCTSSHAFQKQSDGSIKTIKDRWEHPTNKNKVTIYLPQSSSLKYSKEFFRNLSRNGIKSITLSAIDYEQALYDIHLACGEVYTNRDIFYDSHFSVFGVRVERE